MILKTIGQFGFKYLLRLGLLLLVFAAPLSAEDKASKKAKLQVAYVYNILRYTRWAESDSEEELLMAVRGDNLLSTEVKKLEGKMVNGRKLKVVDFDPKKISEVSIVLFTDKDLHEEFFKRDDVKGILTICDCSKFTADGGMISFVEVNKRLRFKVNLEALKKGGLSLSSRLLQLAIIEGGR